MCVFVRVDSDRILIKLLGCCSVALMLERALIRRMKNLFQSTQAADDEDDDGDGGGGLTSDVCWILIPMTLRAIATRITVTITRLRLINFYFLTIA